MRKTVRQQMVWPEWFRPVLRKLAKESGRKETAMVRRAMFAYIMNGAYLKDMCDVDLEYVVRRKMEEKAKKHPKAVKDARPQSF